MVAEQFAKGLLELGSEQTLDAHPDFVRVVREEDARALTVEQIRGLIQRMSLSTARGGRKVAFISDAERLNEEASNALLKAVEEPSAYTVYLFMTEEPERLPATLRSRLTPVVFGRVPREEMRLWIQRENLSPERQTLFLERAFGCPGMVKRFIAEDAVWMEREKIAQDTWHHLLESPLGKKYEVLEQLAQRIEKTEDAEAEWHTMLQLMMRLCSRTFSERPRESAQLAHGLFHAWRLVGSSLSPRLALEWSAIPPYLREEPFIPSFLQPSYL